MKKILSLVLLLWLPTGFAAEYTFSDLMDSIDDDTRMFIRREQGVIREIDLASRLIVIGGYSYYVGHSYEELAVEVSLHGTTAGSFELLTVGMKVEVEYVDFGYARAGFAINEVAPEVEVEH